MRNNNIWQVILLIILALFLRIYNFSFPAFTTDEARIAYRGYTLFSTHSDELGRKLPFLFNSLDDYQLPLVSYISAVGTGVFSKSDLGARSPFIFMGIMLVLLTYLISKQISDNKIFHLLSAFIVATSPVLIFVSKVPNESVILTALFLLLFYLLNRNKLNFTLIIMTMVSLILTSKFSWFIMLPFVLYTIFVYNNAFKIRDRLKVSLIASVLTILALTFFLIIPQGSRSLLENNLSLFSDLSIKNGINQIRGEGIKSSLPPILESLLINKSLFILVGFLHWLSNLSPAVLFGEFSLDKSLGFIGMGAFPKITIIPAFIGLLFLIKERRLRLLVYPIILSFPSALIYSKLSPQIIVLTLPFISIIIAFGLFRMRRLFTGLILFLIIIELSINLVVAPVQARLTENIRPTWVSSIMQDAYKLSSTEKILISDNVTQDPAPFIEWFTNAKPEINKNDAQYPFKIRQAKFKNIEFIGSDYGRKMCKEGQRVKFFSTKRDLGKFSRINSDEVIMPYFEDYGLPAVYFSEGKICPD